VNLTGVHPVRQRLLPQTEIDVTSDVSVWGVPCRRVTTSDASMVNALTSLFGGIWLEPGEQATSP